MSFSRRQFLARGAMVSASATLAGLFATSGPAGAFPLGGYGPLVADPNGVADLPAGFSYKVLATRTAVGPFGTTQLGLRSPAENLGLMPAAAVPTKVPTASTATTVDVPTLAMPVLAERRH